MFSNHSIFLNKGQGVENAPNETVTLQLQGSSLKQLCTKFGAFITMWTDPNLQTIRRHRITKDKNKNKNLYRDSDNLYVDNV